MSKDTSMVELMDDLREVCCGIIGISYKFQEDLHVAEYNDLAMELDYFVDKINKIKEEL